MSDKPVEINDDNFKKEVLEASNPVLVDFWAPWCGPCVAIAPTLEALAKEYAGKVAIMKINVDENAHTPTEYGVRSIPYLALFKEGQVVDSVAGAVPKAKLSEMFDKALS